MDYSYSDGDLLLLHGPRELDMIPIGKDLLGDSFQVRKENITCKGDVLQGQRFGVEPPNFVELEVTRPTPGFAGNTATNNVLKPPPWRPALRLRCPVCQPRRQIKNRHRNRGVSGALQGLNAANKAKCDKEALPQK